MTDTITLMQASQLALNAMEDLITKVEEGSAKSFNICTEFAMVAGSLRAALAQQAPQDGPVAWVLFRRDDEGLEPVMFYGGKEKPEGEFKDRFELHGVYTSKAPNTQPVAQQAEQGWALTPLEPTEQMWGGLARDIVFWLYMNSGPHYGSKMHEHLRNLGTEIPDWLLKEIPDTDSTPPKGTVAVVIYKAMLAAAPKGGV